MSPSITTLMDAPNPTLVSLDSPNSSDYFPYWAISPPDLGQLVLDLDHLQSFEKTHSQAISGLQKLIAYVKRSTPLQVQSTAEDEPEASPEDQAPALVLVDCSSMDFMPELVEQGREGGKIFIDNLSRQLEADYARNKKDSDPKEVWLCFELFAMESFAEGDSPDDKNLKQFLKGVTDAINVKLIRVFDDNTTGLAWKLAVTAQNWFERNPSRYCYVASCDEKTYGCFNSANRTRLRLLAQQDLDPEDIDDLEEYETARRRRGGFEVVDVGKLLGPKVWRGGDLEIIVPASGEGEHGSREENEDFSDQDSDDSMVTITAAKPTALTRAPRPIGDVVRHYLGEAARIKVGDNLPKPQTPNIKAGFTAIAKSQSPISIPTSSPTKGPHFVSIPEPPFPKTAVGANAAVIFAKNSKQSREFLPLYHCLVALDNTAPGRRFHNAGQLGPHLRGPVLAKAGYSKLKDYLLAAQRLGIVTVVFDPDVMWVALNIAQVTVAKPKPNAPAWIANYLHEGDEVRTVDAPRWPPGNAAPLSPPISLV